MVIPRAAVPMAVAGVAVLVLPLAGITVLGAGTLAPGARWLAAGMSAVVIAQLTFALRCHGAVAGAGMRIAWAAAVALGAWLATGLTPAALPVALGAGVIATAADALGVLFHRRGAPADLATGATVLCLGGAALAPVWLGPLAELAASVPGVTHAVVAVSPLSYLAALAHHDYLREQWFYAHSALAALRFDYPGPLPATVGWLVFALGCVALSRGGTGPDAPLEEPSNTEEARS